MRSFTKEVADQIGYYVYRLIDPRDGRTFYVGMGSGNQVFHHARGGRSLSDSSENEPNPLPDNRELIKQIRDEGLEVIHIVHRHGMDRVTALEVEAALIDAIPELTTVTTGHGSNDRGPACIDQLQRDYGAPEIEFQHRLALIKITRSALNAKCSDVYEAVRRDLAIDPTRACQAEYVLAMVDGVCQGVFVVDEWIYDDPDRGTFTGREAPRETWDMYVGRRLPPRMRGPDIVSPVLYSWDWNRPSG